MEKHRELMAAASVSVKVILAYGVEELCADTNPLPFGSNHKARRPICFGRKQGCYGKVADRLAVYNADKVFCGHGKRQI